MKKRVLFLFFVSALVAAFSASAANIILPKTQQQNIQNKPSKSYLFQKPVQLALGRNFSCVLQNNGRVACWGGAAKTVSYVDGLADVIKISAGSGSACAVLKNGRVMCWDVGESLPQEVPGVENAVGVSVGKRLASCSDENAFACALLGNGKVKCWGDNSDGQLGTGDNKSYPSPVDLPLSSVRQVSAGACFACALDDEDDTHCWGSNVWGVVGNNQNPVHSINTPVKTLGIAATDVALQQISAGGSFVCALVGAGDVRCWGNNNQGELGVPAGKSLYNPVGISVILPYKAISAGVGHSCAVTQEGNIYCWGENNASQLGYKTEKGFSDKPAKVDEILHAVSVAVGDNHTCAILKNGQLKCWGSNEYGQSNPMAEKFYEDVETPEEIQGIK